MRVHVDDELEHMRLAELLMEIDRRWAEERTPVVEEMMRLRYVPGELPVAVH